MIGEGIDPYGLVFAAPSSISITNLRDANGNVITDGTQNVASSAPQAPIFAATSANIGQSNGYQYVPLSCSNTAIRMPRRRTPTRFFRIISIPARARGRSSTWCWKCRPMRT